MVSLEIIVYKNPKGSSKNKHVHTGNLINSARSQDTKSIYKKLVSTFILATKTK